MPKNASYAFRHFYLNDWRQYDRNDLDAYLSEAMRQLNIISKAQLEELSARFSASMAAATEIFDVDAFRKRYDVNDTRKRLSKALFEVWSVNLARLDARKISLLIERNHIVKKAFIELMRTDPFFDVSISSSTGTIQRVHKRFGAIEDLIAQVLEEDS